MSHKTQKVIETQHSITQTDQEVWLLAKSNLDTLLGIQEERISIEIQKEEGHSWHSLYMQHRICRGNAQLNRNKTFNSVTQAGFIDLKMSVDKNPPGFDKLRKSMSNTLQSFVAIKHNSLSAGRQGKTKQKQMNDQIN